MSAVDAGHDVQRHLPAGAGVAPQAVTLGALGRGVGQQLAQALRMAVVDDAGVVGVARHRRGRACETSAARRRRTRRSAARHQRVVGRDADLAGVERLAVGDARRPHRRRRQSRADDRRRLAAELERDRRQVLAPPCASRSWPTAGEPVKTMWLKGRSVNAWACGDVAADHGHLVFGEALPRASSSAAAVVARRELRAS